MGVKNWDFIPWRKANIDELTPYTIAYDAPNYITRQLRVMGDTRNKIGRIPFSHVTVLLRIVRPALKRNILPVLIFDGPPESLKRAPNPELIWKSHELYQRFIEEEDPYDDEITEALVQSPALRLYFAAHHIKDICSAMGIPTLTAPSEAEMMAAVMCREGLVGTVVSNDVDTLLFGSPHVTRQVHFTDGEINRARLDELEKSTGLDLEGLRDLAVVCGCDFLPQGLRGVGPRKGIVQLQRYGGLEGLLKANGLVPSERAPFIEAREVFDEPNYISTSGIQVTLKPPIIPKVIRLLKPVMGEERAEQKTAELVRLWKEFGKVQTIMEQWLE